MILASEIDFMGKRKIAGTISALLVVVSIISLAINSLNFGLDFTSGTSVRLNFSESVVIQDVNNILADNGYQNAVIVQFGTDRDIRILLPVDEGIEEANQAEQALAVGETIAELMRQNTSVDVLLIGSDFVSAKVGDELAEQGDYIEDPSYRLVSDLPELAALKETLTLPLAKIGSTRYLITDVDKGLISPAGYWDDGIFVKNDVWIETNRLPRYLGPGLCYYEVAKVLDKAA